MNLKSFFYKKTNSIPLKTQLATLIIAIFSVIIVSIIFYNYQRNSQTILAQQTSTTTTLLKLETQILDVYFSEIDRYSLLLRHDISFMRIIKSKNPLDYSDQTTLQALLRSNFDSRNDLVSYRIYLVNQTTNYEIDSTRHKVQSFYFDSIEDLPNYDLFTKGLYYKSIEPSATEDSFITYYRTIINIENQQPLAIVELTFDTSYIQSLAKRHQDINELYCILDNTGQLLYTNNTLITDAIIKKALIHYDSTNDNYFTIPISNEDYLSVYNTSSVHGYKLLNFKPLSAIDAQIAETRNISLFLAFIAIAVATILAILFISLVTRPLSTLAHRLRKVGSGNFTTTTDVGGSLEIANLSADFNTMIHQIDDLIKKTYISELNEKTSRLIALEAQLNPHFLYNTLQAISSEAIVNNQPKINFMITALASILRYSIKGGDFVTLDIEMNYVKDYLLLQQARFETQLTYNIDITDASTALFIPKISIQTLVENSIIHGMNGDTTSIHIDINCYTDHDMLIIIVHDNGNGISQSQLNLLNQNLLNKPIDSNHSTNIGLINLHSRLQILYDEQATFKITSTENKYTTVTLTIPIIKEVPNV